MSKKKQKAVKNNKRQEKKKENRRISEASNPNATSDDNYEQNGPKKVTKRISPNDINNENKKNSSSPGTKNHTYAEAVKMGKTTSTLATTSTTTMHRTLLNLLSTIQILLEKNTIQNETDDL
jgi:hypothetical protein